jgi:hypothetical protein
MAATDTTGFSQEQQDQNQNANPDTSSSPTAHVEPQAFDAATTVLDTNELLHLIISAVPREHRTRLRRVSKNWQAAVLRIGHVFEPIYYDWCPWYQYDYALKDGLYGLGPVYALADEFVNNPVLRCSSRTFDGVEPDYELSHHLDFVKDLSLAELTGRKHEFIMDPPLSQAIIESGRFEGGGAQVAVLRERGGIKIGDLLEYFGKLNDLAATYKSAAFAVRYYYNESDWEPESEGSVVSSVVMLGGGGEGEDHGEAAGRDEGADRVSEFKVVMMRKKKGRA